MPKVSIITPTYNSNKFIERTIKSVIKQTFTDWEYIIVDDCSNDNTRELISNYVKKDNRIKLIKTETNSGGPAIPKNVAMKKVTGEYVAFLDHDDEWLPEKLEKQIKIFENSKDKKLGLVSCGANLLNNKGKCFSIYTPPKKILFPEILIRNPIYSNSSVLIKKEVIDITGPRDENMKYSEDWEMWIRILKNDYNFESINKPLFNYYFHDLSASKATNNKIVKVKDVEYVINKHFDLYEKYNYQHIGYFRLGIMYFLAGEISQSRTNFKKSIKNKRYFIPGYAGYILSFLGNIGVAIINILIFIYRITNGRVYLIRQNI